MLESWPGGARRGCGLAVLGACVVLVAAGPAPAGEVPSSALSRSLRLDPLFVDSPTLVFRFPQLVAGRDSAQLAFGWSAPRSQLFATTTGSEYGLGAMIRNDAAGGFAFSQGSYLSDVGDPFVRAEYTQSNVFQLGGGGRWGGLRGGVSLRGTRHGYERDRVYSYGDRSAQRLVTDHLEAGAGAGIAGRGVTCDAVLEWSHTTYETESLYQSTNDTLVTKLTGEPGSETGFAVRVAFPAGEGLRIVAVGESRWTEVEWSGQEFRDQRLQPVAHTDVSKTWFTGLSFLFPVPHLDCVAVTGAFEHRDESLTGVSYSEGMATGRRKLDSAALGLSVQRRLWRALVGQAGATTSYERTTTEGSMLRIRRTELEASRRELVGDGFSCGLTYAWRTFDFAGSLTLPFRTDQPFGTIDVYIQF